MVFTNQVRIGPEFFAKARNDYANWKWALIREFAQNGLDARGSTEVVFDLSYEDGKTTLRVENNGEPMTKTILVDKLLSLGSSGKNCEAGAVGGFGKAKEILYFTHESYKIHSGSLLVNGRGAGYNLKDSTYLHGTVSEIVIDGHEVDDLTEQIELYASMSQWRGSIVLNDVPLNCNLWKGSPRREFSWGKVYTNNNVDHRFKMIVRIGGIPMFYRDIQVPKCVIVELEGTSLSALQSSRDGLVWNYQNELSSFCDELAIDKRSALDRRHPVFSYWKGNKVSSADLEGCGGNIGDLVAAAYATLPTSSDEVAAVGGGFVAASGGAEISSVDGVDRTSQVGFDFVVKNNVGLKVKKGYTPDGFSPYGKKLVSIWLKCLLVAHKLLGRSNKFTVGFILDENREAEYGRGTDYGDLFLINPAVLVEGYYNGNTVKRFKNRWRLTGAAGKYALLAVVAHEMVHALGCSYHDENYAGKLTELMGIFLANRHKFSGCFK